MEIKILVGIILRKATSNIDMKRGLKLLAENNFSDYADPHYADPHTAVQNVPN